MSDEVVSQEAQEEKIVVETPIAGEETNKSEAENKEPEKKKDGFQEAINRQTRKYYEQKARADALESQLRQKNSGPEAPSENAEPDKTRFANDEEYNRALIQHEARKIAKSELARIKQEDQNKEVKSRWQKDADSVRKQAEDFDEVVSDFTSSNYVTQAVDRAILESDRPAAITHYLATHLDVAEKIAGMSDFRTAIEIGKIEVLLSTKEQSQAKKASAAPAPIAPIGGKGSGGEIDPEKESPKEFAARRNKERSQRGKR